MPIVFNIRVAWDDEAKVWFVEDSDVPGLVAEAPTQEAMRVLLQQRVPELLELNRPDLALSRRECADRVQVHLSSHQELSLAC